MANSEGQPTLAEAMARIERLETEVSRVRHDVRGALTPAMIMADVLRGNTDPRVATAAIRILASLDNAVKRLQKTRELVPSRGRQP